MRYALDPLITAIIQKLDVASPIFVGGNKVNIYTEAPLNAQFPHVAIEPTSMNEFADTKDSTQQTHMVELRVTSKFNQGSGGWGTNNTVMNQLLEALRNKNDYLVLTDDFKIIGQRVMFITKLRDAYDDAVYFETILSLEFNVIDTQ